MIYLKYFENQRDPQINDYAIVSAFDEDLEQLSQLSQHIGRINDIVTNDVRKSVYIIEYPKELISGEYEYVAWKNEILYSSKNKNDCEIFLQTKKYNL